MAQIFVSKGKSNQLTINEDSLYVRFKYNASIVEALRTIPLRRFDTDTKVWEVPLVAIHDLKNLFSGMLYTENDVDLNYEEPVVEIITDGVFTEELAWISVDNIREFTESAIAILPEYFFSVAASSTGKYHPTYALGEGGLVRHTKAALKIANELFRCTSAFNFSPEEQCLALSAITIHDGVKHGLEGSKYTVIEHPLEISNLLEGHPDIIGKLDWNQWIVIKGCIESHMGEWNTDRSGNEIMPKPVTKLEKFVHLCDYLASRKFLEVKFD